MADFSSVYTWTQPAAHQGLLYPSSHTEPPEPFQQHPQGGRIPFVAPCLNDSHAIDTLDSNTFQSPDILGLNRVPTSYDSNRINLHDPNSLDLNVSCTPVTTDFATAADSGPSSSEYNSNDAFNNYGLASIDALSINVNYQRCDDWREKRGRYAYGQWLGAQELAQGGTAPTDATRFSGLDPQRLGSQEYLAQGATNYDGESIHYTAHQYQGSTSQNGLDSLELPQLYEPTEMTGCRPPKINLFDPLALVIAHVASRKDDPNGIGLLDSSTDPLPPTPHHLTKDMSVSKASEPPEATRRRFIPRMSASNSLGASITSTPISHTPDMRNLNGLEPQDIFNPWNSTTNTKNQQVLDTSTAYYLAPGMSNDQCTQPSENNVVNFPSVPSSPPLAPVALDQDLDPIVEFTTIRDNDSDWDNESEQQLGDIRHSDSYETGSLHDPEVPDIDHIPVEDALEPHAGQLYKEQQNQDASSVEMARSHKKSQRRIKSKPSSTRRESQQRRKRPQQRSTSNRRTNPPVQYYCAVPPCNESLEKQGRGFKTKSDYQRHYQECHKPDRWFCGLSHKCGKRSFNRRERFIS